MMIKMFAAVLVGFTLMINVAAQPMLEKPGLISTDRLATRIDDSQLRIIDARPSLRSYMQGHLPGAIYLNTETVRISKGGVPARLLSAERLAEIFGKLGISNDDTVVVYSGSEDSFAHAAYVIYLLEWLGHRAVGLLDGGFEKWAEEGREVTQEFSSVGVASFHPDVDDLLLVTAPQVERVLAEESAILLDARQAQQFQTGHIPTARSFFLQEMLEGDAIKTWKSPEAIRFLAAEAGVKGDRAVITYCTSGRESAQIWFALRHIAGLSEVSSYHGSWIDWTSRGLPVERGSGLLIHP